MTEQEHRGIPVNVMRYTPLLLLLFFMVSAGTQRAYSQAQGVADCPDISVACPDSIDPAPVKFAVRVTGDDPSNKRTFKWTVSAGKIISGQGTLSITVDSTGFEGKSITATVEVGGIPEECGNVASCATPIADPPPTARKFDEYGDLSWDEERARLENFAAELQPSPSLTKALHHRRSTHRLAMRLSNKRRLLR